MRHQNQLESRLLEQGMEPYSWIRYCRGDHRAVLRRSGLSIIIRQQLRS